MIEALKRYLSVINISLTPDQERKFIRYYELLIAWNEKMNLTAITEPEAVALKHFADSLAPLAVSELKFDTDAHLVDVGTGAGFPAVPLKIMRPELRLTLLDSLKKRLSFLEAVCQELDLDHVALAHARAEDAARDKQYRERFDVCTARALAPMPVLSELTLPFIKTGGFLLAYKGPAVREELENGRAAIALLGGKYSGTFFVDFNTEEMSRFVCKISKVKNTPSLYPRKAGLPEKKPLL